MNISTPYTVVCVERDSVEAGGIQVSVDPTGHACIVFPDDRGARRFGLVGEVADVTHLLRHLVDEVLEAVVESIRALDQEPAPEPVLAPEPLTATLPGRLVDLGPFGRVPA